MKLNIINFLLGYSLLKAEGPFAERVINIAREKGVFIWGIRRIDLNTLTFFVSRKAAKYLLSLPLPPQLSLTVECEKGLPVFLSRYKRRRLFLACPFAVFAALILSTCFIWNVNVVTEDGAKEEKILSELSNLGLKRGVFKFRVDQSELQKEMLLSDESLLWLWVDIKGASAIVRFAERTQPPEVYDEDSFCSIYSTRDATITSIIAENGIAAVSVGDTVLKGQLLIDGKTVSEGGAFIPIRASGSVKGSVWEEETVTIPKKQEIRTPTGRHLERLSINFSDFCVKLFINSRISYKEYDIIEKKRAMPLIPISFNKNVYEEVDVTYLDNDISEQTKKCEADFCARLEASGALVTYSETSIADSGESVAVTVRALCEEDIAIERRMNFGENTEPTQP